jgi:hypothetical protein
MPNDTSCHLKHKGYRYTHGFSCGNWEASPPSEMELIAGGRESFLNLMPSVPFVLKVTEMTRLSPRRRPLASLFLFPGVLFCSAERPRPPAARGGGRTPVTKNPPPAWAAWAASPPPPAAGGIDIRGSGIPAQPCSCSRGVAVALLELPRSIGHDAVSHSASTSNSPRQLGRHTH